MTHSGLPDDRCYIIAEAGSNHDGDLDKAHELIDVAAQAGADAIKFQLFRAAELYPATCGPVDTPIGMVDFFELLRRYELPPEWLEELDHHAASVSVDFLCTPFDQSAVETLDRLDVIAMKVASPELTHHELLRAIALTGREVILSTGMSTLGDVEEALQVLDGSGAGPVTLLQCVTSYPAPVEDLNLGAIPVLATAFDRRVGLSDHSLEPCLAPATAVALGATVIEKHVTASRAQGNGPDHPFAIEPEELRRLVRDVRDVEAIPSPERLRHVEDRFGAELVTAAIGSGGKRVAPAEAELAACDRRTIHAIKPLSPGDVLDESNVKVLRGERNLRAGLHPRYLPTILGARVAKSVAVGEGITWTDLLT